MAVAVAAQQKIRWDELEEDDGGDLDFLLPPRVVIGPDAKGLKNMIEYHFVDEGNKVKVTTTTRHRRPSPRSATARHAWRSRRCPCSSCMER
jgi:translation initiation factor 3 subunit G